MRVMVLVKASRGSEAGEMPSQELLTAMTEFNEALSNAGVLLAGEGLHPSSKGVRVHFSGKDRMVTDGPFAETKELIAGYWLWQVGSLDEAVDWVKRCPNPHAGDSVIEIRPVFEAEDFGQAFSPELRAREERLLAEAEARRASPAVEEACPTIGREQGTVPNPASMSKTADTASEKDVSRITPYLTCAGAAKAIDFYKEAFGAEEVVRLPAPDGRIMHACLSINGAHVMLSDQFECMGSNPETLGGWPVTIHLIVDDADAWAARAEKAGAKVAMPVSEQFWGDRYGVLKDPFGHAWSVATPVRRLSEAELREAARAAMAPPVPAAAVVPSQG